MNCFDSTYFDILLPILFSFHLIYSIASLLKSFAYFYLFSLFSISYLFEFTLTHVSSNIPLKSEFYLIRKMKRKDAEKNKPTTSRNTIWRKTKDILSFQWIISISKLIRKMRNAFEMALVMETICCVCGIVVNTLNFAHNLYHLSIHS